MGKVGKVGFGDWLAMFISFVIVVQWLVGLVNKILTKSIPESTFGPVPPKLAYTTLTLLLSFILLQIIPNILKSMAEKLKQK